MHIQSQCIGILLLSSLVTRKYLQYNIDITTEKSFRQIELTDTKIWISKNASLCQYLANWVTYAQIVENVYRIGNYEFSHVQSVHRLGCADF